MAYKAQSQNKFLSRNNRYLYLFISIALMITGCDKTEEQSKISDHYDVIDSGYGVSEEFYWMDNKRIIFSGIKWDENNKNKGNYKWDFIHNIIVEQDFKGLINCFFKNKIYYFSHTSKDHKGRTVNHYNLGEFGNEKEIKTTLYKMNDPDRKLRKTVRNGFECSEIEKPVSMKDRIYIPLLKKHGYLDFGPKGTGVDSSDDVFFYHSNGGKYKLNFQRKDVSAQLSQYVEFKNEYFFWDLITSNQQREEWKKNKCINGWWINPETGQSYSECIPYAPWKSSHIVTPTKKGLFLVNQNYSGDNPRDSGGYLYRNNQFKKVIKGLIMRVKVSPDGCKLALSHKLSRYTNKKEKMTLKIIDICSDKKEISYDK